MHIFPLKTEHNIAKPLHYVYYIAYILIYVNILFIFYTKFFILFLTILLISYLILRRERGEERKEE